MADAIRDHLPPEKVLDLNLGDFDWPVGIGLHFARPIQNERIARNRIAQELTHFFLGADVENHQTREYLREAAKAARGDLLDLRLLLTCAPFRAVRIGQMKEQGRDVALLEEYHGLSEGRQGQVAGPILVRLGEILGDDALRPIFCQRPHPAIDLGRWMAEGVWCSFGFPPGSWARWPSGR